jgi:RNA polymerase sigma-70 factor (ECF subfamily)
MQPATARSVEPIVVSDADIVDRAARGDRVAFEILVGARLAGAFRLATAILGNDEDAADATQNVFLAVWRELPRLRDRSRFDAWFRRILVNECRMRLRQRGRVNEIPLDEDRDRTERWSNERFARGVERFGALDAIERAFDALDPDDRVLIVLHHLEGRPLGEIAVGLGVPIGTLKWRLHGARQALQSALEAEA